jgi:hypothetical protein
VLIIIIIIIKGAFITKSHPVWRGRAVGQSDNAIEP